MRPTIIPILCLMLSTAHAGVMVFGEVKAPAGAVLPEMIVYLESADRDFTFTPPVEAAISQKGAKFTPALLVISVNQTVSFKNDEDRQIQHNVFSRSPAQPFDLGLYDRGNEKRVTFVKSGVVRLYCSIHRLMDGVIYVCPTPFFAHVGADGKYEIKDVPPGHWKLKTWQLNARFNEQEAEVKTDDVAVIVSLQLDRK